MFRVRAGKTDEGQEVPSSPGMSRGSTSSKPLPSPPNAQLTASPLTRSRISHHVIREVPNEESKKTTITPQGIRDLDGPAKSEQPVTFALAVQAVDKMRRELNKVWKCPSRGMTRFEERFDHFVTSILPQLQMVQLLRRTKTVFIKDELSEEMQTLRSKYVAEPVNLNDQKDACDRSTYHVYEIGRALVQAWDDPAIDLNLPGKIESLKQGLPRFVSVIKQQRRLEETVSIDFTAQMQDEFLKDLGDLLNKFILSLKEPLHSPANRRRISLLLPNDKDIKPILDELEGLIGQDKSLLDKIVAKVLKGRGEKDKEIKRSAQEAQSDRKLDNDYVFLSRAIQLCEMLEKTYCQALKTVCQELRRSSLAQVEPSQISIVNDIFGLVSKHAKGLANLNQHPENVIRDLLERARAKIEFEELPHLEKGMKGLYQAKLVENMARRPCQIPPFHQLTITLLDKLYFQVMQTPQDIPRVFKLEGEVCCFVNGKAVEAEGDGQEHRYKAFLKAIGEPFGQPDMVIHLAEYLEFPLVPNKKREMESVFRDAYPKLVHLDDAGRQSLKELFDFYGKETFEKAIKYFKVFQHFLEQGVLYHFSGALLKARMQKFQLASIGFVKPRLQKGEKKNQFTVEVNGSQCRIKIVRRDGVCHPDFVITQEFSVLFDVEKDEVILPKNDEVVLTVTCPQKLVDEDEAIRALTMDLDCIAKSLDFPTLKFIYS